MGEFKGTKEKVSLCFHDGKGGVIDVEVGCEGHEEILCQIYEVSESINYNQFQTEEHIANAHLIRDAFNIRQEIKFDLPELVNQRNKMLLMLEKVREYIHSLGAYRLVEMIELEKEIEVLINKATEV